MERVPLLVRTVLLYAGKVLLFMELVLLLAWEFPLSAKKILLSNRNWPIKATDSIFERGLK